MSSGDLIEVVTFFLLKGTEFDPAVAHHIGVGREALAHHLHGVFSDRLKILVLQVHDVELAAVFLGNISGDFNVLLRRTARQVFLAFHTNLDIEDMRVVALLLEQRHHHGAVDASRNQRGNIHGLDIFCKYRYFSVCRDVARNVFTSFHSVIEYGLSSGFMPRSRFGSLPISKTSSPPCISCS